MAYLKDRSNLKAVETLSPRGPEEGRKAQRGGGVTERSKVPVPVPEQLLLITAASKAEGSSGVRGRPPSLGGVRLWMCPSQDDLLRLFRSPM